MISLILAFLSLDPLAVSDGPREALSVDLNRDRRPDLVVVRRQGLVTLLRENNSWREATTLPLTGEPSSPVTGDFNNDGHHDVALADHDTFGVQILLGDGRGGLRKAATIRAKTQGRPHVHGLVAGDLNRDGAIDLLFASSGEGEVVPLLNDGKANFAPQEPVKMGRQAWYPVLADFNSDGILDALSSSFEAASISVALGSGRGGFHPARQITVFARPFVFKVADLDADGQLDVFGVHDDYGRLTILKGDGKGNFTPLPASPLQMDRASYGVEALDYDHDGKLDLCLTIESALYVAFQRSGKFQAPTKVASGVASYLIARADFDGDGQEELAIPSPPTHQILFFP